MTPAALGIIPARYASSRFPGKPLVLIDGKSMVMRVYEQACKSSSLQRVIVATDDQRIFDHVKSFGGEVIMTSTTHVSGTSRAGEVLEKLQAEQLNFDVVVNIQGDEPFINPIQIDLAVSLFNDPSIGIGTLIRKIQNSLDIFNPNVVKVITDINGKALYFSRSPIPYVRGTEQEFWAKEHSFYSHIGMYAFRTNTLSLLLRLSETAAEKAESLEQLRWLQHGFTIHTALTDIETVGIDTPEDLLKLTNNP